MLDATGQILLKIKLAPGESIVLPLTAEIPNGHYVMYWDWKDEKAVSRFVIQR